MVKSENFPPSKPVLRHAAVIGADPGYVICFMSRVIVFHLSLVAMQQFGLDDGTFTSFV